jgi:2-polyprenyl-6-methoxyphenol hydroxylase-like FAD-dependent oxidoreductase
MTSSIRKKTLEIGIVGLGTAGLASGIFLSRLGHTVKIYEKTSKDQLNQTVGAGIGVKQCTKSWIKNISSSITNT